MITFRWDAAHFDSVNHLLNYSNYSEARCYQKSM